MPERDGLEEIPDQARIMAAHGTERLGRARTNTQSLPGARPSQEPARVLAHSWACGVVVDATHRATGGDILGLVKYLPTYLTYT